MCCGRLLFQFLILESLGVVVSAFTVPSLVSHQFATTTGTNSFWKVKQNGFYNNSNNNKNPLEISHAARPYRSNMSNFGTIEWSNLLYDDTSIAFGAWEWTNG
jgi:hypothetical protein